jgi:hypothetical protein
MKHCNKCSERFLPTIDNNVTCRDCVRLSYGKPKPLVARRAWRPPITTVYVVMDINATIMDVYTQKESAEAAVRAIEESRGPQFVPADAPIYGSTAKIEEHRLEH